MTELATQLELNKSTVFYTLKSMEKAKVVIYDDQSKIYSLGPELLALGAAASEQADAATIAKQELLKIIDRVPETMVIYRRVDDMTISIVDKIEYPNNIRITVPLGQRIPIQGGSFGRAFLAHDPDPLVEEILAEGLQQFTDKSITALEEFHKELQLVRDRGWAVDHEGYVRGVSTVAAPVRSLEGSTRLVIAAVGMTYLIDEEHTEAYGRVLAECAERITSLTASLP